MKKLILFTVTSLFAFGITQAQILISVVDATPNGIQSGGSGSGTGVLTSTPGSIVSDVGMPVTTYTVSNLDLTSLGGTASESFQFKVTYSQTGGTGVQFNSFGNVSVTGGDDQQVDTAETLTVTIALTSTSFPDLSLNGLTAVRVGGFGTGEAGTFTYAGAGSPKIVGNFDNVIPAGITEVTLSVSNGAMNFQKFSADFVAVPEPATFVLMGGLAALGLVLYRRRLK